MSTDTTPSVAGGFIGDPADAFAPVAVGGCCGSPAATSGRVDTSAGTCCGSVAEAAASGGCCGETAKSEAIASGAGCCG